jgi:hypothetical protein
VMSGRRPTYGASAVVGDAGGPLASICSGYSDTDEVSMLLTRGSYSPTSSRNRRFLLLYSVVMAYATGGM